METEGVFVVNNAKKTVKSADSDIVMVIGVEYTGDGTTEEHTRFKGFIDKATAMECIQKGINMYAVMDMQDIKVLQSLACVKEELIDICEYYGNLDYMCYNNDIELTDVKID